MFASLFTVALSFVSLIQAAPAVIPRRPDDVFVPQIYTPNESTVWVVGTIQTVTWDTTHAPKQISNGASIIFNVGPEPLGGPVLAQDFDLRAGAVNVTVPEVKDGSYTITLFGDSGNFSPAFQVVHSTTQAIAV